MQLGSPSALQRYVQTRALAATPASAIENRNLRMLCTQIFAKSHPYVSVKQRDHVFRALGPLGVMGMPWLFLVKMLRNRLKSGSSPVSSQPSLALTWTALVADLEIVGVRRGVLWRRGCASQELDKSASSVLQVSPSRR